MAIDAIGVTQQQSSGVQSNALIKQDDFLTVMLNQLKFQDPLKPMDNQEFLAQLAQFSAIEINRQQSEKVESLLHMNSAAQAMALLGNQVQVEDSLGSENVGKVTAVRFQEGIAYLTVTDTAGNTVTPNALLSNVTLVRKGT